MKGIKNRLVVLGVVVVLLALCWQSGLVGLVVGRVVLPAMLPWAPNDTVEVSRVSFREPDGPLRRGITVTVSAGRMREIIGHVLPRSWLLPPGLIRPGMLVKGTWYPDSFYLPPEGHMPLMVVVDAESIQPAVYCRYPADDVNQVMEREVAEALREKEEYILGTYETVYYIRFKTLRIRLDDLPLDAEVKKRSIDVEATGRVRFVLEENWFDLRNTGKLRILHGVVDLDVGRDDRGVFVSHKADIDRLDIDFHNVAPWLDEKLSEKLRKKWTKSLNKEKKRRRIERGRFPHWAPVDLELDIELFSVENEPK